MLVTDEMVEAACAAIMELRGYKWPDGCDDDELKTGRENMTAALTAALSFQPVEVRVEAPTEHPIVTADRVYNVLKRYRDQGRFDWDHIGYICRAVAAIATTEGKDNGRA